MITTALTFLKANKMVAGLGVLVLLGLAIFAIKTFIGGSIDKIEETAKEAGALEVTTGNLTETLERTEQANEARKNIDRNPDERRASCLRNSRTPENC